MDQVLYVLWVTVCGLLFLSVLVLVHEGGHYLAARAFDVRVSEFYLGLPCRFRVAYKSRKRGTEFGVTPFLLGGYNRISGMEGEMPEGAEQAFAIVQREGRIRADKVAEELGISVGEAYTYLVALSDVLAVRPYFDPELGERPTQSDYPAAFETLARDARLLTEYDAGHDFSEAGSTADAEPRPLDDAAGQLERECKRTYLGLGFWGRVAVLVAGPLVNLVLAFVLVCGTYMSTEYRVPLNTNVIGEIEQSSLAETCGLEEGDTVVRVAGTTVSDWDSLAAALGEAIEEGTDFEVTYVRDGVERSVTVPLAAHPDAEILGVVPASEPYHLSLGEAARASLDYAATVGSWALRLIMPQHTMEVLERSSSVVGISVMAARSVEAGPRDAIALIAAVSMSLGFMNLLPIPPLDGGKLLIEAIAAVIRRPVPKKIMNGLSYAGLAFFLFIFVMALRNDVVSLMGA